MAIVVKNKDYIRTLKEAVQFVGDSVEFMQCVYVWTEGHELIVFASNGHTYYKQTLEYCTEDEQNESVGFALDANDIKVVAASAGKVHKDGWLKVVPTEHTDIVRAKEFYDGVMQRKVEPVEYKIAPTGVELPTRPMATILNIFVKREPKKDLAVPCQFTVWRIGSGAPNTPRVALYVFTNESWGLEIGCMPMKDYWEIPN